MENIELTGVTAADAGQQRAEDSQVAAAEKPSWEAILADPEYNRNVQAIVSARVKEAKQAQEQLERISPLLERLRAAFGAEDNAALTAILQESRDIRQELTKLEIDPEKALQNPLFTRLTALGVSAEDAYFASNRQQCIHEAVQQAEIKLTNAIRSGAMRPRENGDSGYRAGAVRFDYALASQQQRQELKKAIRAAAARGEKIYP